MLVLHNLLHRINVLGEPPDLLRGVGLPKGCRTTLIEATSSGSLTEKNIIPCVVPPSGCERSHAVRDSNLSGATW